MFGENKRAMKHADILNRLKALRSLFPVDFYFAGYDSVNDQWNDVKVSES